MKTTNFTRTLLIATALGLAGAAVLYAMDFDTAMTAVLVVVAIMPVVPLLGDIAGKIRRRQPGVDLIALLAVTAALALGEYLTAAIIGLMLATGQALEEYAAGRAQRELTALVARAPRTANRFVDGSIETMDVEAVHRGDRLLVRSGEVIPVDGVVMSATAVVDESALTGESLPADKMSGDLVSSGAVNAGDPFEMQATDEAADSTYAGVIRLVEAARESKGPSVRLADRWAGWFVPLTLLASGLAWLASGDPMRALAVLVVATPCPLLLAVPIAIVSGVSRAARRGVVFRGGGPLETLSLTRNVVIDKTGTVTVGQPSLRSVALFEHGFSEDEVLSMAASVDQISTHILARAIVEAAHRRGIELAIPTDVVEEAGSGVAAKLDGRSVAVGKLDWLLEGAPIPPRVAEFRRGVARVAPTASYMAIDGEVVAAMVFEDAIRPDAARTLRALRRAGVERVVMATGDHPVVAKSVATAIGVDDVLSEATPREKVAILEELRVDGVTAMVGDGINDAPALAAADVGVAMGARGATASSEAADIVLIVDELQRLVDAIGIAQRSRRIALQSVVLGMGLSVVAMTAAALGLFAPLAGAFIQEGIDVIAMLNALRALGGRPSGQSGPKLTAEMSRRLDQEHQRLRPLLDQIRDTADELDTMPPSEAGQALRRLQRLINDEILPHETADEKRIYPQLASILPGEDPLATMSRTHREIFHLADVLDRHIADIGGDGPEPADVRDLRRILYGLHAILRLHFDQEEELYLGLLES